MWDPYDDGRWTHQRPSYRQPVVAPAAAPGDSPCVCVSVNQSWIPFITGALSQLAQPSTWQVDTDADRADVLGRVQDLIALLGAAMPCGSAPPVITGIDTGQRACNIAGYLANAVIKASIDKAVQAVQQNQTVLGYGLYIIGAIPGAGFIINALIKGLYVLYQTISGGSLADYQDAVADEALWSKITCAIFNATSADGGVTDSNFAAVQAGIAAVSYTHTDVTGAINQYVSDIGASGLEQLQSTGALAVYDCSSCGTGVSTGPSGLPVHQDIGSLSMTIPSGSGSITAAVVFDTPFLTNPIVSVTCDNPDLIASYSDVTMTGFTAEIAAAVDVDIDTSAVVSWIAALAGAS